MKATVIGAGFTGLVAAYELAKAGAKVTVWEASDKVGGLASGFGDKRWEWELEKFYHHIFTNDKEIIELAEELGIKIDFRRVVTASYLDNKIQQFDSASSLLALRGLSLLAKVRMGCAILLMKLIPNGLWLERWTAVDLWQRLIGREGYRQIWQPLLDAKFQKWAKKVNMAWLWARIYKRTAKLGYFEGGFASLSKELEKRILERGGKINLGTRVEVDRISDEIVISTVPKKNNNLDYLWGQTLVLELDQGLMGPYWLNVMDVSWPFLAFVEHTNLVNKDRYGNRSIVYIGNYLASDDPRISMSADELIELYEKYIKVICPRFQKRWIKQYWLFAAPYAQPVFPTNYSKQISSFESGAEGRYQADMSMVYPWDRGTNYAVKMGRDVARLAIRQWRRK